jgi:hypothetical protein
MNAPVTEYSDLYQEVSAAYMEKGHYDIALKLLQAIIDTEDVRYNLCFESACVYAIILTVDTTS